MGLLLRRSPSALGDQALWSGDTPPPSPPALLELRAAAKLEKSSKAGSAGEPSGGALTAASACE